MVAWGYYCTRATVAFWGCCASPETDVVVPGHVPWAFALTIIAISGNLTAVFTVLRIRHAMSGTETGYGATRPLPDHAGCYRGLRCRDGELFSGTSPHVGRHTVSVPASTNLAVWAYQVHFTASIAWYYTGFWQEGVASLLFAGSTPLWSHALRGTDLEYAATRRSLRHYGPSRALVPPLPYKTVLSQACRY